MHRPIHLSNNYVIYAQLFLNTFCIFVLSIIFSYGTPYKRAFYKITLSRVCFNRQSPPQVSSNIETHLGKTQEKG